MRSVLGGRGRALVMHLNPISISISGGSNGQPQLGSRPFNDPEVSSRCHGLRLTFLKLFYLKQH